MIIPADPSWIDVFKIVNWCILMYLFGKLLYGPIWFQEMRE